nr:MAG TPA: hypothetical protein [Caudoviricetes sp.]
MKRSINLSLLLELPQCVTTTLSGYIRAAFY